MVIKCFESVELSYYILLYYCPFFFIVVVVLIISFKSSCKSFFQFDFLSIFRVDCFKERIAINLIVHILQFIPKRI